MSDLPPHTNDISMATSMSQPTGGQSDVQSDKGTTAEADVVNLSPNTERSELSGDQNATKNPLPATQGDTDSANVEEADTAIDGGVQLGTEPEVKKKKKKSKKKGAAGRKNVTGFEGWFCTWFCRARFRLTFSPEFYADTPTTPAEAAKEKKEIYNA
ncbi:hypothetical protein PC116_g29977 [Phytophthora cactorum]|nr:hypothetical protein PC116_g29977 [Phytophthora cactorum]